MRSSSEFLFVIINSGDLCVLDKESENFLKPPDFEYGTKIMHPLSFGKVPKFPVIDVKDYYDSEHANTRSLIVAVDENGTTGTLHEAVIGLGNAKAKNRSRLSKKSFVINHHMNFHIPKCSQARVSKISIAKLCPLFSASRSITDPVS